MSKFFSNFEKQVDAKGRLSVPASFRSAITAENADRIFCFPCLDEDDSAIECYPPSAYFALLEQIEGIIESPEAREHLEWAVIARGVELAIDGEGRAVLPERLLKGAGIDRTVVVVGRGDRFQLRSPESFAAYDAKAGKSAGAFRHLLMKGGRAALPAALLKTEGAA